MQPLPTFADDEIRKLAQHEIGHWVIARALNFVPSNVTAKLTLGPAGDTVNRDGVSNVIVVQDLNSVDDAVSYLERRIQMLWAGPVAEALNPYSGQIDRKEAVRVAQGPFGKSDTRIAWECIHLLRNLKCLPITGDIESQLLSLSAALWDKTIRVVETNKEIILEVAEHLAYRVELAGSDNFAVFEAAEIEALPAVQQWFGKPTETSAHLQALAASPRGA